jgi:hypothetical protein
MVLKKNRMSDAGGWYKGSISEDAESMELGENNFQRRNVGEGNKAGAEKWSCRRGEKLDEGLVGKCLPG